MLLKDYYKPSDDELEAAFRKVYHFIQPFSSWQKFLVWLLLRSLGDKLLARIAQEMHGSTMRTLQDAACGMHADFFKRKRVERAEIREMGRGFVRATIIE